MALEKNAVEQRARISRDIFKIMPFILTGKLNGRAVNFSRKFPPRSPLRFPRLGVSIWKNQKQKKLGEVKAESRKQKAESRKLKWDKKTKKWRILQPFRTWSGTLHGRPGARCSSNMKKRLALRSTIHNPRSAILHEPLIRSWD